MRACCRFVVLAFVGVVLAACGGPVQPSAAAPTPAPQPSATPTDVPVASPEPSPSLAVSPANASDRYLQIAQKAAGPIVRGGLPPGEWDVHTFQPGDIQITMPLTVGFSDEQTVRVGKIVMASVINDLFRADPELARVNVIGTTPDGVDASELPAISIVADRGTASWGTVTVEQLEQLAGWNVSSRVE